MANLRNSLPLLLAIACSKPAPSRDECSPVGVNDAVRWDAIAAAVDLREHLDEQCLSLLIFPKGTWDPVRTIFPSGATPMRQITAGAKDAATCQEIKLEMTRVVDGDFEVVTTIEKGEYSSGLVLTFGCSDQRFAQKGEAILFEP